MQNHRMRREIDKRKSRTDKVVRCDPWNSHVRCECRPCRTSLKKRFGSNMPVNAVLVSRAGRSLSRSERKLHVIFHLDLSRSEPGSGSEPSNVVSRSRDGMNITWSGECFCEMYVLENHHGGDGGTWERVLHRSVEISVRIWLITTSGMIKDER